MKHEITIDVDDDALASYTDERLAEATTGELLQVGDHTRRAQQEASGG